LSPGSALTWSVAGRLIDLSPEFSHRSVLFLGDRVRAAPGSGRQRPSAEARPSPRVSGGGLPLYGFRRRLCAGSTSDDREFWSVPNSQFGVGSLGIRALTGSRAFAGVAALAMVGRAGL